MVSIESHIENGLAAAKRPDCMPQAQPASRNHGDLVCAF